MNEMRPYFESFKFWLGIHHPHILVGLMNSLIDVDALKPYVLDWAKDITKND